MRSLRTNWLVLGNPENRRVTLFQNALQRAGYPPAVVVGYREVISREGEIDLSPVLSQLSADTLIRIESPGENFKTEQLLLGLGLEAAQQEGSPFIEREELFSLKFEQGLILYPRQWYLGFCHLLSALQEQAELGAAQFINSPREIAIMFDKTKCQALLNEAGIPIPEIVENANSYDQLLERMREQKLSRAFVKLAHGSSASGVIAFETANSLLQSRRQRAITSADLVRGQSGMKVYNSLKIRTYTDEADVRDLINWVFQNRAHVEQWIPKDQHEGRRYDIRSVAIGTKTMTPVVRLSHTPLTNLHLGNERLVHQYISDPVGFNSYRIELLSLQVLSLFPNSTYAGIDICRRRDDSEYMVLEVNAFGDLLPNVRQYGLDTYDLLIREVEKELWNSELGMSPPAEGIASEVLGARFHLIGLDWFAKHKQSIIDGKLKIEVNPNELKLIQSVLVNEDDVSHLVYADWLDERGLSLEAYAQRLAVKGMRWSSITDSTCGLMMGDKCLGMYMRTPRGFRCWRNINMNEQEYVGELHSLQEAVNAIYARLTLWQTAD